MNVQFDTSINLGNIITIILGVVTLAIAWTKLGGRLDMMEYRVEAIERAMEKIAEAMIKFGNNEKELALLNQQVAAMSTQVATLHTTVEELRRGEGFISGPRRGNIEGEWPSRTG